MWICNFCRKNKFNVEYVSKQTVNFLDVLLTLLKHKITILSIVISLTLLALIISLIWTKTYKSSSEIVQVQGQSAPAASSILQNLTSFSISGNKVGGETILVVLNSQTLRERVIEKFNLFDVYDSEIIEAVLKNLNNNLTIEEVREGGFGFNPVVSVKISVTDKEAERAKSMNDFILSELDSTLERINRNATLETLEVIERRYDKNLEDLQDAERELNQFQNEYGIIQVPTQVETMVESLASIKARITQTEVELAVLSRNVDQNSSAYKSKAIELEELRSRFGNLIERSENLADVEDSFFSLLDYPDLLLDYVRLEREMEIQHAIQETLFPQLEQQRIMRENSSSGIRIIDDPNLPTYKDSPKRAYIVLAGFFFSIILSLLVVFFRELTSDPESESSQKISEIKQHFLFKQK